jgi:hypothetical protein
MLVPQDQPCPKCGHGRGDHQLNTEFSEQCVSCGCTATWVNNYIGWDPSAPPTCFDWKFALVMFYMSIEDEELYTDTLDRWRPGYTLQPGERDDLRRAEMFVRDLWKHYGPRKAGAADFQSRSVEAENAAVDRYEREKGRFWEGVLRLVVTGEWKSYFPAAEHSAIDSMREIVIARGGTPPQSEIDEWRESQRSRQNED